MVSYRDLYQLTSETNITRIENDAGNAPIYIGKAASGSSTSDLVWQIQKLTYLNGAVTEINFADATPAFAKAWSLRATYSYS